MDAKHEGKSARLQVRTAEWFCHSGSNTGHDRCVFTNVIAPIHKLEFSLYREAGPVLPPLNLSRVFECQ